MHRINDEHGNPCPHSPHSHETEPSHPRTQECPRAQECPHGQEHGPHEHQGHPDHPHGHDHDHSHEIPSGDKMTGLLDYMLKHNEHHAAELDQVAQKLREEGRMQAADQIRKAVDEFQKGNMYLSLALSLVRENR